MLYNTIEMRGNEETLSLKTYSGTAAFKGQMVTFSLTLEGVCVLYILCYTMTL